jgi:hypothetical protein
MPTAAIEPSMDLATSLNRDCHCVGTDVPLVQRWIERDLEAHGIAGQLTSTHPHLFSNVPVFVDSTQVAQAYELISAVDAVVALPGYQEAVLAQAPSVARADNGAKGVFLGYDFHLGADGPQLIEINTNAGGALLNTLLLRAQHACCPQILSLTPRAHEISQIEHAFVDMLRDEWKLARGKMPLRRIAIVDDAPAEQYLYPEFLLFKKLLEANGYETVISDPGALAFDGMRVTHDGRAVDLIYNRLTDFYLAQPEHSHLREAHHLGAVVLTPHPRSHALYANKRNLTLLSDENELRSLGVPSQTAEILLRHVPKTRSVLPTAREEWWTDRKRWFFKPSSGYAGRGAYRGDKITRKMFEDVLAGDYVAQTVVPAGTRTCEQDVAPLRWDLRIYAYGATPLLQAARLYAGQTTNFRTQGGGFAPVFLIDTPPN